MEPISRRGGEFRPSTIRLLAVRCVDKGLLPDDHQEVPLCPACTRSLSPAVLLQRDDERLVICPHCGWEMLE